MEVRQCGKSWYLLLSLSCESKAALNHKVYLKKKKINQEVEGSQNVMETLSQRVL